MNNEKAGSDLSLAFTCDSEGVLTAISGPGLPWLDGFSAAVGQQISALWPEPPPASAAEALRSAAGGQQVAIEFVHGQSRWNLQLQPARNAGGDVVGVLGTLASDSNETDALRKPVDAWPVCVFELDMEGRICNVNRSGATILGNCEPGALFGTRLTELVDPLEVDRISALLTKGYGGQPSQFEFTDISGRFIRSSVFPFRSEADQHMCCLFGLAQVVSNRQSDEFTLADSEQEYRLLVQSSPLCIHQIDLDGCLMSMNESGLAMLGIEDEQDIVGLRYLDAVSAVDRPRIARLLDRALAGEASQFEFMSVDGHIFASSFVPIQNRRGEVSRLMGLTRDATDERAAQRALRESEQRLELALQGANLGLWDMNTDSGHLVLDEGWAKLLGYAAEDLAPTLETMRRLVHPDDHEAQHRRLQEHLSGASPSYESIHRMRGSDGRWRWIVDRGMVTRRDQQGRALRVTGTTAEITSKYEEEKARRELEARLQQAQRMESIGHLAGGIAHDFNNVLTVISGNVDFALDEIEAGRRPDECLEQIQRATERAGELISQLMTFSRRRPVRMTIVDLNKLSREIMELVARVMPENIQLKLESESSLPMIEADPSQLEQIVINLCVNARDAMPAGGDLTLSLTSEAENGDTEWVALQIADNGQGMDEATLARAFDPFFTTKESSKGTGLGLAMVYGSVQQHGGRVSLSSKVGIGTSVTIHFPACDREMETPTGVSSQPVSGEETILVVEDEALVRNLAAKVLTRAGYRVLTAVDGQDGIEVFQRHADQIEMVLLDVVMPRRNGGEACKEMLKINPEVRILFTSGYDQNNALPIQVMREHNFPVIPKPYDNRTLLGKIRLVLDR